MWYLRIKGDISVAEIPPEECRILSPKHQYRADEPHNIWLWESVGIQSR